MTWIEAYKALSALCHVGDVAIRMDVNSNWYVSLSSVERKEGGCLSSGGSHEATIEQAVMKKWHWAIDPQYYLVINAMLPSRRAVRWNGFMWQDVQEEK
jgi:hypothetical protein